jgi:adenine-specific DNA-methyltransferase
MTAAAMARTRRTTTTTTRRRRAAPAAPRTESYKHPESTSPMRPDVGAQSQFRKKKPPQTYRYDSSLSPALDWDGQNSAREQGEALIKQALDATLLDQAKAALEKLRALSRPFLNWAGKAERLAFDVPTLPLFVHERLSTKAIIETLGAHKRQAPQLDFFELFGDPQRPIADQVLRAYEHRDKWVNRMILGDSLVVMNSLLHYESLGGQVQMIYLDPPYGVSFGSNFQPFIRRREVKHNEDDEMTREPEMVQAYRDTWELGLHSYLTYLRDRFLLCRELLTSTGSMFVQIGDENLHHVRQILDEVFGSDCHVVTVLVKKKGSQRSGYIDPVNDYLLWYSKTPRATSGSGPKFYALFVPRELDDETVDEFSRVELADGSEHTLRSVPGPDGQPKDYRSEIARLFVDHPGARLFRPWPITNGGTRANQMDPIELDGKEYVPPPGRCWSHTSRTSDGSIPGMERLRRLRRLVAAGKSLDFKRYLADFPFKMVSNWWDALGGAANPTYVVQTNTEIVKRCILMTTEPGDLVFDPTCGSGTTAYVAEQWGRRWITVDTSRVPLALARQRLLTATFPYYQLRDDSRGPAGGFVYVRKQNSRGDEVGGIVPHITSGTLANDEPPTEEVLVDRPEVQSGITRVAGPFCVEATIPTPIDWEGDGQEDSGIPRVAESQGSFIDRMLEVLRKSPVLRVNGSRTVTFKNIRPPAKTLSLSAEALVTNGDEQPVAFVFGPESAAVSEKLVWEAAKEASAKKYSHLYVIGFAIQPNARNLVEECEAAVGIAATYVQATPDLMMGDLLKNMRSSQIFSVCGLPEVAVRRQQGGKNGAKYQVELLGYDVFDPVTMEVDQRRGDDVPAWFLDTDYNGLCFHVSQAFFPRTSAWENLKKALKGDYDESVWDHLSGTTSAPFEAGEHGQVAVKVIDDRGNELLVVKSLKDATR